MFKVGDRVIPNDMLCYVGSQLLSRTPYLQQIAIVTEITERGFKWKLEGDPVCIHPLYGSYSEGECLQPDTYRLALDTEKPVRASEATLTFTTNGCNTQVKWA